MAFSQGCNLDTATLRRCDLVRATVDVGTRVIVRPTTNSWGPIQQKKIWLEFRLEKRLEIPF